MRYFPKRFSTQLSFAVFTCFKAQEYTSYVPDRREFSLSRQKTCRFKKKLWKKQPKKIYAVYIYLTIYGISSQLSIYYSSTLPTGKKKKRTLIIKAASVGIHINGEDSKDQGGNAQHHSQHWDHVVLGMPFYLVVQYSTTSSILSPKISRWFNLETSYPKKLDISISQVSLKNHEDIWKKKQCISKFYNEEAEMLGNCHKPSATVQADAWRKFPTCTYIAAWLIPSWKSHLVDVPWHQSVANNDPRF